MLAGELPDAILPPISGASSAGKRARTRIILDPVCFFADTHPTENLMLLVKEVTERLARVGGGTPVIRLETGFGVGKIHALIAAVYATCEGERLAEGLAENGLTHGT